MATDIDLEELAGYLDDIDNLQDARIRMLYICDMLRELTEPGAGLNLTEIRTLLELKGRETDPGYRPPTRNTVMEDLHALHAARHLDMDVHIPAQGKNEGFWYENTALGSTQACMLINIVQACGFITQSQCNELVEALRKLAPAARRDLTPSDVFVDRRVRAGDTDVFGPLKAASRAMHEQRKIRFRYYAHNLQGGTDSIPGQDDDWHEETPLGLIFSNNNYYLETWCAECNEDQPTCRYRLDRMCDATVSNATSDYDQNIQRLKDTLKMRARASVDMLGGGKIRRLFIRVLAGVAPNIILNRFGYDLEFNEVLTDPATGEQSAVLMIEVQLSSTFFRWLFGLTGQVQLIPPDGTWASLSKLDVGFDELMEDYRETKAQYLEMLQRAVSIYE